MGSASDEEVINNPDVYPVVAHPVDKTDNYQALHGVAGDSKVVNGIVLPIIKEAYPATPRQTFTIYYQK